MPRKLPTQEIVDNIVAGNIRALAKAISLIESTLDSDIEQAQSIIEKLLPISNSSNIRRIGISGVPGVGKSTFIEAFGQHILAQNPSEKLAVLAVDPTSSRSGGSILGDKTRMPILSRMRNVFIRPSPAGTSLGGVAKRTREAMILCEAAGYTTIFVETVGVGQSETAVANMTDFFLVLLLAGAGDDLQAIKRGIMEVADCFVINKADGDNRQNAEFAQRQIASAIHYIQPKYSSVFPSVFTCSSKEGTGISELYNEINNFIIKITNSGELQSLRSSQNLIWFREMLAFEIERRAKKYFSEEEERILNSQISQGTISPFRAVEKILRNF